jgi:hypothetical protein
LESFFSRERRAEECGESAIIVFSRLEVLLNRTVVAFRSLHFFFFFFFLRMNKNSVIDFAYLDHTEGPASSFSLHTPMDRPPRSPKLVQSSELRFARVNLAPPAARSKSAACTSLPPFELVKGEIMV